MSGCQAASLGSQEINEGTERLCGYSKLLYMDPYYTDKQTQIYVCMYQRALYAPPSAEAGCGFRRAPYSFRHEAAPPARVTAEQLSLGKLSAHPPKKSHSESHPRSLRLLRGRVESATLPYGLFAEYPRVCWTSGRRRTLQRENDTDQTAHESRAKLFGAIHSSPTFFSPDSCGSRFLLGPLFFLFPATRQLFTSLPKLYIFPLPPGYAPAARITVSSVLTSFFCCIPLFLILFLSYSLWYAEV